MVCRGTTAKASLISQRSMSAASMPAGSRAFCEAGVGAVSMITGSVPAVAMARMRAAGLEPVRLDVVRGGEEHGRGAVDDAAGVAGGVDVVDLRDLRVGGGGRSRPASRRPGPTGVAPRATKEGASAGEALGGGVRPRVLVLVEEQRRRSRGRAPATGCARSGSRAGAAAARRWDCEGEGVDVVAGEALEGGDEVGADALRHLEEARRAARRLPPSWPAPSAPMGTRDMLSTPPATTSRCGRTSRPWPRS